MNYLYDTNIFIYYLAGDDTVSELFSEGFLNKNYVVISPIVRIELLCFSGLSDDPRFAQIQNSKFKVQK